MEFWQLKCFLAVADTGSFSKAAETLYVTQPAISQQIGELERQFGVELFARTRRSAVLTAAGKQLYPRAKEMLAAHDSLVRDLNTAPTHSERIIRIGFERQVQESVAIRQMLIKTIDEIQQERPEIRLQTYTMNAWDTMAALQEAKIDIAFVFQDDRKKPPSFVRFDVGAPENIYVVYRPDEKTDDFDLRSAIMAKGIIQPSRDTDGLQMTYACLKSLQVKPEIHFCPDIMDVLFAVELGNYAAILPASSRYKLNCDRLVFQQVNAYRIQVEAIYNEKMLTAEAESLIARLRSTV